MVTQRGYLSLPLLCEGNSLRATSRLEGVSINTVYKLLVDAGEACASHHDQAVRGVRAERVQCDEIWSFTYAKQHNLAEAKSAPLAAGDVWTWTALDSQTKLIIAWLVGDRDAPTAYRLFRDLRERTATRLQLTTDGLQAYLEAVPAVFGADVDYARLVKLYGEGETGQDVRTVIGAPDPAAISTSHVERHNLTIRMSNRRFARKTNAFSKKFANHCHMLAIFFCYYNWCRQHLTLGMTPAMAAGLADESYDVEWIVGLLEAQE